MTRKLKGSKQSLSSDFKANKKSFVPKCCLFTKRLVFIICFGLFVSLQRDVYEKYQSKLTTIGIRFEIIFYFTFWTKQLFMMGGKGAKHKRNIRRYYC